MDGKTYVPNSILPILKVFFSVKRKDKHVCSVKFARIKTVGMYMVNIIHGYSKIV